MTVYVEIYDSVCWNLWQCMFKYMTVFVKIYDSVRWNIWQCML